MSKEKKILLTTNEQKIKEINLQAETAVKQLNVLIEKSEVICKTTFNKDERDNIRDKGMAFILEYFKPKFTFPSADDELNLRALGIDLAPLHEYLRYNYPIWNDYIINQNDNGVFELTSEPEQIQSCYHYTENDKQIEAYEIAVKISDLLNEALSKGYVIGRDLSKLVLFGDIITKKRHEDSIIPNGERIARLR